MRYFIELAYKGTDYHGWQYQPNAASVQETLNKALTMLFKVPIDIVGAGRTDAGVHARQMYAHFDLDFEIDVAYYIHKLNSFLPQSIAIIDIHQVHPEAHARFDASKRTYEYHIHRKKNAFVSDDSWYYSLPLDVVAMNEACQILFQHIDFECFSKTHTDVNTFNCTIFEAQWEELGDKLVFTIAADRFLRNMVRAIVGTMVEIGKGKISLDDFVKIIEGKDRSKAGFSVPAQGLFLTQITYDYLNKKD